MIKILAFYRNNREISQMHARLVQLAQQFLEPATGSCGTATFAGGDVLGFEFDVTFHDLDSSPSSRLLLNSHHHFPTVVHASFLRKRNGNNNLGVFLVTTKNAFLPVKRE